MTTLRVATYNVCNLFLDAGHRQLDAVRGARPKRSVELRALARTIDGVAADVLALQEVGGEEALAALNERLEAPYPYLLLIPGNSTRGIHLAFASRYPMALTSHAQCGLTDEGGARLEDYASAADAEAGRLSGVPVQRDVLCASLEVDGQVLKIINVHLKSPHQPKWRKLEAGVIRQAECRLAAAVVAAAQEDGSLVLVAGDFNDVWDGEALSPLRDAGLANPLIESGQPESYWPGKGASIDFILTGSTTRDRVVPGSVRVHVSKRAQKGSDHYPVSLEMTLAD